MCMICLAYTCRAQDQNEIQIAKEYLLKGEKEKALVAFRTLAKAPENIPFIHNNYLSVLLDLGKYKDARELPGALD